MRTQSSLNQDYRNDVVFRGWLQRSSWNQKLEFGVHREKGLAWDQFSEQSVDRKLVQKTGKVTRLSFSAMNIPFAESGSILPFGL